MRAHRAKSAHLPPSIYWLHFDSYPLPLFPQVHRGGCYREKFFFIFIFWFSLVHRMSVLKLFFWILHSLFLPRIIFYFFVSPIRFLLVFYFFYFFKTLFQLVKFSLGIPYQLLSFLVLYSFDYGFEFTSYRWELWLRYNFSISYFRFWISTCFSIVDSMLWLFNSLSL